MGILEVLGKEVINVKGANATVTILYPVIYNEDKITDIAIKYGTTVVRDGQTIEFNTTIPRCEIKSLELALTECEIPFDLIEYGSLTKAPNFLKFRPHENYVKEIQCEVYTGQEDGDEDGLITVSALENILKNTKNEKELRNKLNKLIASMSFKGDRVEDILDIY